MMIRVFYSWHSDLSADKTNNIIQSGIDSAIGNLKGVGNILAESLRSNEKSWFGSILVKPDLDGCAELHYRILSNNTVGNTEGSFMLKNIRLN